MTCSQITTAAPTLDTTVVTAGRIKQNLSDVIADMTIVDSDTIEKSGANSVADILARQPGIEITRNGGPANSTNVFVRGMPSQYTAVPTLIFDEVDTGIGGGVAEMVGKALRALGGQHQVLAVTHLPQVAACGEQHWQVSKHSEGEQTLSEINILDSHQRIEEVARMLGGETITDTTRSHAKELLEMAAR